VSGWNLDADLELSAGLDLTEALGFGPLDPSDDEASNDDDASSLDVDLESALTAGLDGGVGLAASLGGDAIGDLLDVGEDLGEGE
jgi:hypothetical protein